MRKNKHIFLMIACIALAIIPGACGPNITNVQVIQGPLQKTDSPPRIQPITVPNCYGNETIVRKLSSVGTLEQEITLVTQAGVELTADIKAKLTAEISRTYQQNFSAVSTQMNEFEFKAAKNTETAYEVIWREYRAKSTVSYTVKGLFSSKTYSVPYTYTLYIPDMEPGGSKKSETICPTLTEEKTLQTLHIEAEGYAEQSSHVDTTECNEGGRLLGWINNGEWVSYDRIDFGSGGYKTFKARIASAEQGGEIDIRLDGINGQSIGVCQAPATGDWQNWATVTCDINSDVTGERTIYLLFRGQGEYLYNINWFEFGP